MLAALQGPQATLFFPFYVVLFFFYLIMHSMRLQIENLQNQTANKPKLLTISATYVLFRP